MPRTIRARLVWGIALALVLGGASVALTLPGISAPVLLGFGLAAAIAFGVQILLARDIAGPIERLTALADDSGERRLFSVEGPEDVERLAASLRRMSAAIRAERIAAEAERDRLAMLVDELDDGIALAGSDDRIVVANRAAERILGRSPLVRQRLTDALRDHEVIEAVERARHRGQATATVERTDPRRYYRAIARSLDPARLLLVLQDLTEAKRLETVRQDFVANVSHELRTPLASLKAMAETLEESALDDPPAARDFIGRMHREIDQLSQMVGELLTLTRIESGQERLDLAPLEPSLIVDDAVRRMGALAARAGVELTGTSAPGLPLVRADGERIAQVLVNLIHNAVKFTPSGGAVRVGAEPSVGGVTFRVADTGAGIPADEIGRVFERFYKGDRSRAGGGTGLGLAIAKHIVQAHGGSISAASEGPGRGAAFAFTLPAVPGLREERAAGL